jgi:hypothetical protein
MADPNELIKDQNATIKQMKNSAEEIRQYHSEIITELKDEMQAIETRSDAMWEKNCKLRIDIYDAKTRAFTAEGWQHEYRSEVLELERKLSDALTELDKLKELPF